MTRTGFVLANLWRKRTRTVLTLLSIVTAFLLFGLLQAVNVAVLGRRGFRRRNAARDPGARVLHAVAADAPAAADRIGAGRRQGHVAAVVRRRLAGEHAAHLLRRPTPRGCTTVYPEYVMPDSQWKAFADTRTGMIVGRQLADQYGWKIGDKVPIASNIFPQQDGSKAWTFDLVGIYDGKDEEWQRSTNVGWINYAYFDEANQFGKGRAGIFTIKLADPDQRGRGRQRRSTRCSRTPPTRPRPRPRRTSTSASSSRSATSA